MATERAAAGAEAAIVVDDPEGAGARVAAPVCLEIDLGKVFGPSVDPQRLWVLEEDATGVAVGRPIPMQFEPHPGRALQGTLWWLMPPGNKGQRSFRLIVGSAPAGGGLQARADTERRLVDISEGDLPVLRYNHGTVPVPPGIPASYARGDYVHPLFGPEGQALTDDYSPDHPHHRGVSWAWPITRWKGEARDLWAVTILPPCTGAVWSRPVVLRPAGAGPVFALIDAENVWKWGDKDPIVREEVRIRAFGHRQRCRFIDIEVRLTGLVDEVTIGGRPKEGYGGFSLRTFPAFDQRKIAVHVDPPQVAPRRAWFHLQGNFAGGKEPAGVVMLEDVANPGYPNYPNPHGKNKPPYQYPPWRSMQPAFPGDREVPLPKGQTMVLKHRLWIHPGKVEESVLTDLWSTYARPPKATLLTTR